MIASRASPRWLPTDRSPWPRCTRSRSAARSTSTKRSSCAQALAAAGYRDAADDEPADLCVVNTCTVTAEGDSKSRQAIRQLARRNPGTRIVVMGCYATRAPDEVAALPGRRRSGHRQARTARLAGPRAASSTCPRAFPASAAVSGRTSKCRTAACSAAASASFRRCGPTWPAGRSSTFSTKCAALVDDGYREIVLTGIHLGHYGVEWSRGRPQVRLAAAVALARAAGRLAGRISHAAEQHRSHGGDPRADRRHGGASRSHLSRTCTSRCRAARTPCCGACAAAGAAAVSSIAAVWCASRSIGPALTTDIIVGFPGETDEDFAATCRVASEVGFSKIHIFPFSPRRGTPAAEMTDQVPSALKAERCRRLADLDRHLRSRYFGELTGRRLQVLVEGLGPGPGRVMGTSCRYAQVELPGETRNQGQLVEVTAGASTADRICAVETTAGGPSGCRWLAVRKRIAHRALRRLRISLAGDLPFC